MISELGGGRIWLILEVINLRDTKFDIVESFAEPILIFGLFALKDSVYLSFDLVGPIDQLSEEIFLTLQVQLCLILHGLDFILNLLIALIALLQILICSAQSLFVLVHAQGQAIFQLLFFRKNGAIVDLLDCFPLGAELGLHLSDHIIAVPLTTMLDVLDECVPDFSNFYSSQYLRNLRLFNAISPFLHVFKCFLHCLLFHIGMLEFLLGQSVLVKRGLILRIYLWYCSFGFDQEAFEFLLIIDKLSYFHLSSMQCFPDLHKIDAVDALVHDRLAHFTQAEWTCGLHVEADHWDVIHVINQRSVKVRFTATDYCSVLFDMIRMCWCRCVIFLNSVDFRVLLSGRLRQIRRLVLMELLGVADSDRFLAIVCQRVELGLLGCRCVQRCLILQLLRFIKNARLSWPIQHYILSNYFLLLTLLILVVHLFIFSSRRIFFSSILDIFCGIFDIVRVDRLVTSSLSLFGLLLVITFLVLLLILFLIYLLLRTLIIVLVLILLLAFFTFSIIILLYLAFLVVILLLLLLELLILVIGLLDAILLIVGLELLIWGRHVVERAIISLRCTNDIVFLDFIERIVRVDSWGVVRVLRKFLLYKS